MIFENNDYYIDLINEGDYQDILGIYNSNKKFLVSHLGKECVNREWLTNEINSMRSEKFCSCKIVEKKTGHIIGYLEFKLNAEVYLSILIIHREYHGKGIGRVIYNSFETYIFDKCKSVRIDVVTGYNDLVMKFWKQNGFEAIKEITLEWNEQLLPAVVMKKKIINR